MNKQGQLLWATPETHRSLQEIKETSNALDQELAPEIKQWLSRAPSAKQKLALSNHSDVSFEFVEARSDNEFLLRLSEGAEIPDEQLLQTRLNLTRREAEVLLWIAQGKTNREIGLILDISPRTVNKHLEQIFQKIGAENRTTAASVAIKTLAS